MAIEAARLRQALNNHSALIVFIIILAGAAALRFWAIGSRPGWEYDEPSFNVIGQNIADHGALQTVTQYGQHPVSFLFQPPFYFLLLGGWYKIVGSGITEARYWAAAMSLLALTMLFLLTRSMFGRVTALVLTAFVAVDAWMVYANRIGWIENTLLVFIVGAMWLYWRAINRPTNLSFAVAGVGVGVATIFKHTGAYLFLAVLIYWLIQRKWVRQHLCLLASAGSVVGVYLLVMTFLYQHGGQNVFSADMFHQSARAIGNAPSSDRAGTISGLRSLRPLLGPYKVFVGTVLAAVIAGIWLLVRVIQCLIRRSWSPISGNSFAFAWMSAGVIGLGAIKLKFPSYFEIALVPAYVFLAGEVKPWFDRARRVSRVSVALYTGGIAIAALGLLGFVWRIVDRSDNALKATAQYAQANIPPRDVVLTEQAVGGLIRQPFCDIRVRARQCEHVVKYIITYTTADYKGPNDPVLRSMLRTSTQLARFKGFKETLVVWRVNR